jgi:exopolysaccharide production protein ExoY
MFARNRPSTVHTDRSRFTSLVQTMVRSVDLPFSSPDSEPGEVAGPLGGTLKRSSDVVVASLCLFIFAPLMVAIALAIWMTMGGPVLFPQRRIGYKGTVFTCLKFRTMRRDADAALARHLAENPVAAAEWASTKKLKKDPRITRLGLMLRRSSLDELPQLLNVLRGEMSCVGPRPVVADELANYGTLVSDYLRVRPGLTGLWQVGGRNDVTYAERVALDSRYVRTWSLRADLTILLRTVPAVVLARGSY